MERKKNEERKNGRNKILRPIYDETIERSNVMAMMVLKLDLNRRLTLSVQVRFVMRDMK